MKKFIIISWIIILILVLVYISYFIFNRTWVVDESKPDSIKTEDSTGMQPGDAAISEKTEYSSIKLSFAGDVILSERIAGLLSHNPHDFLPADVKNVLTDSDISMVNLETSVSTRGVKEKNKQFTFRASPDSLKVLTGAGVDVVTLANNHVLDYGRDALLDTLEHLKNVGIKYVGAGKDVSSASSPVYLMVNDAKVAFIGSSHVIPFTTWHAGANKPGVASTYDPERIRSEIAKARETSDLVVVYVHWGEELKEKPLAYQKNLARIYIDEGADMVIGSHPHVLQGLEYYKGKLIAYSLGNFIFTNTKKDTMILSIELKDNQIDTVKVIPCEINNCRPMLVKDESEARRILKKVEELSFGVKVDSDGVVRGM